MTEYRDDRTLASWYNSLITRVVRHQASVVPTNRKTIPDSTVAAQFGVARSTLYRNTDLKSPA